MTYQHHFSVFSLNSCNEELEILRKLVIQNYPKFWTLKQYIRELFWDSDFWCFIYDDRLVKIAECSLKLEPNKNEIHIQDMYVNQYYRNEKYCTLLLLNVFEYFGNKYNYIIEANLDNHPAICCYTNIFGEPLITNDKAYFFLNLNDL